MELHLSGCKQENKWGLTLLSQHAPKKAGILRYLERVSTLRSVLVDGSPHALCQNRCTESLLRAVTNSSFTPRSKFVE